MPTFGIHQRKNFHSRWWLIIICTIAVIARILFCLLFLDLQSDYYWEYGEIAKNLYSGKGYSLFYWDGNTIEYLFDEAAQPQPSAFMPPGYVVYLLPFLTIENIVVRNCLILLGQIALGVFSIIITYTFTKRYFSKASARISSALIALSPDFIYATVSYTPTIFYHAAVISLFILLYEKRFLSRTKALIGLGLLITVTVYFRSEFLLYAGFILISFLIRRNIKPFVVVASVTLLLLLPWQIRNASTFNRSFVPLTTNFGLNFYRGHNPYSVGNWDDESVEREMKTIAAGESYELVMNDAYLGHAIESIKARPVRELQNTFVKIFHLWLFNPDEPRTSSLLYSIPSIAVVLLFVLGALKTGSWSKHRFAYLFLAHSTVIAVVFFALPRHQAMMKIGIIPFAGAGLEEIIRYLTGRFQLLSQKKTS